MDYAYVGISGLRINRLALGTQTFGWNIGEEDSMKLMDFYFDQGGIYFDTADSYNKGASETILGNWIRKRNRRDKIVIGTKVFFETGPGPNDTGSSRKHIFQSVDTSLERLHTDYIDLLQIHCYDARTSVREVMRTLDDLVRSGKVRYIGLSNFPPSKVMELQMISRYEGTVPVTTLQLEYSLLVRSPEWELLPLCGELGIGVMAWSPLSGGWLTGKYRKNRDVPADSRVGRGDRWDDDKDQRGSGQAYAVIEELVKLSGELHRPVSQISLNWILSGPYPVVPLVGARSMEQLCENFGALEWTLDASCRKRLDAVSRIAAVSPYSFIGRYTRKD
jgi:aryl-alcohol dehydrogenase-like predicted oxidoreductase